MDAAEAKNTSKEELESGSSFSDPVTSAVKKAATAAAAEAAAAAIATTSEAAVSAPDKLHRGEQHLRQEGAGLVAVATDPESGLKPGAAAGTGGLAETTADPDRGGLLSTSWQREQQDGEDVGAGVSAALAAAAAAAAASAADPGVTSASPAGGEADGKAGGLASSVLSAFLSAALRNLLPWVLPSALSGARAADVQVDLRKKQVALTGVSLQPQPLMAVSGAPFQLLLCSVGSVRLRLKEKRRPAAAADAAGAAAPSAVGLLTPTGDSPSPKSASQTKAVTAAAAAAAATAAAATAAAESLKNEGASSVVLSVEDMFIVLAPMNAAEWSRQQLLTLALQRRRSQLESINRELPLQQQRRRGFPLAASALVSHWIDRHIECASVDITNVHIRFEALIPSGSSAAGRGGGLTPFALGLTLRQLFVRTIHPQEFEAASRAAAAQQVQQQERNGAESDNGKDSASSASTDNRRGIEKNEGDSSSCSAFDVRDFGIYTNDELLLLTPHTRTAAETIEHLRMVAPARDRMQQQEQQQEQQKEHQQGRQQERQQEHSQRQQEQEMEGDNKPLRRTEPKNHLSQRLGDDEQQKETEAQAQEQGEPFHDRKSPQNQQQRAQMQSGVRGIDWSSSGSTVVLDPVTVQLFLRKNSCSVTLVKSDKGTSSTTGSSGHSANEAAHASGDSVGCTLPSGTSVKAGAEESEALAAAAATSRAARAAYAAVVQSGRLSATLSPGAVRGIQWLAANAQQHRDAVETAEAVLSLVRPFRPSCKVKGNSGIWWRFAIRAVRRLQRSGSKGDKVLISPEEHLAAEESLKLQLMRDKALDYRQLRLLQLQGKASAQQEALLLQLQDTIPLPLLLQSHTAAGEEFMELQKAAAAARKTWSPWIPLWRKRAPNLTSSTATNNNAEATTGAGATKLPPVPPLYLHELLKQPKRLHEGVGEPVRRPDTLRGDGSSDFVFFDARSQPGTARFKEGNTARRSFEDGTHGGSTGALLQAASERVKLQAGGTAAEPLAQVSAFIAVADEGDAVPSGPEDQVPQSDTTSIEGPGTAHAIAHDPRDDSSSARSSDTSESDDEDAFEDCLDLLTPREQSASTSPPGLVAALDGAPSVNAPSATELETREVLQCEKHQNAYTMSISVFLSSVSVACCLGGKECKGVLRKQSLTMQQHFIEARLLCRVDCLGLEGLIGVDGMEGTASVRGLGVYRTGETSPQTQTLVCRHPSLGSEPLLLLHVVRGTESLTEDGTSMNSSRSSNSHRASSSQSGQMGQKETSAHVSDAAHLSRNIFVRLQLRRVVCLLDPQALRSMSLIGASFSAAAKASTAAAAGSSQACTLLRLGRTSDMIFQKATGVAHAAWDPQKWGGVRQRLLLLSPKRQQQLRDSAAVRYVVTVEAPTFIAPALGGQAVICHLGELRALQRKSLVSSPVRLERSFCLSVSAAQVCSARLAKASSFQCKTASARRAGKLEFADNLLAEKYEQLFSSRDKEVFTTLDSASPEASGERGAGRVRHVSLRTHHGVLLRDSHMLIHSSIDQLMSEMHSEPSEDRGSSPCKRQEVGYWRWSSKDSHRLRGHGHPEEGRLDAFRQRADPTAAASCAALFAGWSGCTGTSPVFFPSELVAGVHVEHADVFDPGELLLPFDLRGQGATRSKGADAPASAASFESCDAKEEVAGAEQHVAPTGLTQQLPQQRSASLQGQHASEIHVRIDGQCSEVSLCLSRRECAALSSTVEALKEALAGETFDASDGCIVEGVASRTPSRPQRINSQQPIVTDVCSTQEIPVYLTAELDWNRVSMCIHHLDSAEPSQAACSNDSSLRDSWQNQGSSAKDALVLQACKVSMHISSSNNSTAIQLLMKHLLLEQPYLPKDSLNRYILRLPSLSAESASASDRLPPGEGHVSVATADKEGQKLTTPAASLLLHVALKSHAATGEGIPPVALSICTLKPMTVNFRPTPLTWLTDFVKDPAAYPCSSSRSCTLGSSNDISSGQAGIGCGAKPPQTPLKAVPAFAPLPEACNAAEGTASAISSSKPCTFNGGKTLVHSDALLRELRVEFQSVDFLWTTRHTDLPLATAALQGASFQMRLHRHSTHLSTVVRNLSLHFVLEDARTSPKTERSRKAMRPSDTQKRSPACADSSCSETSPLEKPDNRPTLLTTEILGLMPGTSCAIKIALEAVHPLSPSFSGLGSRLLLEIGTCRLVYLHPKFWRLFSWMVDDFIGTLTSSYSPAPSPPHESAGTTGGRPEAKKASPEVTTKPIQRSSSLEELAYCKAQEAATSTGTETKARQQDGKGVDSMSSSENKDGIQSVLVPSEGLKRIFLLADAGRRLLGLNSTMAWLEEEQQLSAATINNTTSKGGRLVLPHVLPFGVFHYEVIIFAPRLLVPPTLRPKMTRSLRWPPTKTWAGDSFTGGFGGQSCDTSSPSRAGEKLNACSVCGQAGGSEAVLGPEDGRVVECLLENVIISNSWRLSGRYGLLEDIKVAFKGARAFADVSGDSLASDYARTSMTGAAAEEQQGAGHFNNENCSRSFCRRCARRFMTTLSPVLPIGNFSHAASVPVPLEAAASNSNPATRGRYLFGSVDVAVHVYRSALIRTSFTWLRVEVGLLPLRLDAQTLKLVRDVIESNVAAQDPDVIAKAPAAFSEPVQTGYWPRPDETHNGSTTAETPTARVVFERFERARNGDSQCMRIKRLQDNVQQELSACMEQLHNQQLLQGLLEPQLDFVELLKEWGNETFLLELIVSDVQLAVYEPPVQQQILQLQQQCASIRQRLRRMQGEPQPHQQSRDMTPEGIDWDGRDGVCRQRVLQQQHKPFLLFHATRLTVRQWRAKLCAHEIVLCAVQSALAVVCVALFVRIKQLQCFRRRFLWLWLCAYVGPNAVIGSQSRRSATSWASPMNVGSSTFFAPDFASPFSVVFTDDCCPLALLQQQLEPLTDSILSAESEATTVAVAAAASSAFADDQPAVTSFFHRGFSAGVKLHDTEQQSRGQQILPLLEQRENPLAAAFVLPWVDRLEFESSTEEQTERSGGRELAAGGDSPEPGEHRKSLSQFGSGGTEGLLLAPQGVSFSETHYVVLFPVFEEHSFKPNEQRARLLSDGTSAVAFPSQTTELKFHYWSATTLPVTPLSNSVSGVLKNLARLPRVEQLHIVQELLKGRQHQRRQRRIISSSRSPRCVLSLPLLARIREFLSSDNREPDGAFMPAAAEGGAGSVRRGNGVSLRSTESRSHGNAGGDETTLNAVEPSPATPSVQGELSGVRNNDLVSMFSQKARPYRCSSSVQARPRAGRNMSSLNRSLSTGSSIQRSKPGRFGLGWVSGGSDWSSGGSVSSAQRSGRKDSPTRLAATPGNLTHFGSKTLDLCLSSFESAQRFAAALASSGNPQRYQDFYAGAAGGGEQTKGDRPANSVSDTSKGSGSECNAVRFQRVRKVSGFLPLSQQLSSSPVELTSMQMSLHLSNASVFLPIDSSDSGSGSLVLRGCVNLRRSVDAAQDPLAPGGMSEDAANAERLYSTARRYLLGSDRRISPESGPSGSSSAAYGKAREAPQQEDARWQGILNNVNRLEDRFCPGVRIADFLLQRAAVTCLGNGNLLQRLEASAADIHSRRKQLELRRLRALRRTGTSNSARARAYRSSSPDREEGTGIGLQHGASRGLTAAPELRAVATRTAAADVARGSSSELLGPNINDDGSVALKVADAVFAESTAALAADAGGSARLICSDLQAHLSQFRLPPTAPGRRHVGSSPAEAGSPVTQRKSAGHGAQKLQGQPQPRSPDDGCCCFLLEPSGATTAAAVEAMLCDCCCHHPQDFNTLHLSPCELELSYLDCLLACRCAAEQARQLDEVQKRQQQQKRQLVRQTRRCRALQRQLILSMGRSRDLSHENRKREESIAARRQLSFPRSLNAGPTLSFFSHIRQRSFPGFGKGITAPAASSVDPQSTAAAQSSQVASALPRQSHFLADLPLLRITLLNDHLDCLQAPLLQLLLLRCRVTRASSVLPLHPVEAQGLPASPQQQLQQVAAVTLAEASLRLWALNPVAVAFEPVIESLPLSLIVREAPYSVMRYAYASTFEDDGMAHSSESSQLGTERGAQEGSSNEENSPKTGSPVLFRFDGNAADLEACAFSHDSTRRRNLARGHLPTGSLDVRRGDSSQRRGCHDGELYRRNPYYTGMSISSPGSAARGEVSRKRYLGILLSCPQDSGIEANLSPLLLQSVLGCLTKWHSDFAQHVQQQQQRPTAHGVPTKCTAERQAYGFTEDLTLLQDAVPVIKGDYQSPAISMRFPNQRGESESNECALRKRLGELNPKQARALRHLSSSALQVEAVERKRGGDDSHQQRAGSAPSVVAASVTPSTSKRQKQQPVVEASDPRRGRLFLPYHIINQTGLELGVSLLAPPSAGLLGPDGTDGGTEAIKHVLLSSGLPSTLRLCRSRGREDESSGSDPESGSETSEAGKRSNPIAASIHWDFGPALQKALISSHASGADDDNNSKWTASCPPSPSASRELTATFALEHSHAPGGLGKWYWLQPSEERALRQIRVAIGTATTIHVALQLVDRSTDGKQPSSTATTTAEKSAKEAGRVCTGADSFFRRWRLVVPVPLDRVGVYIQPLTNTETEKDTGFLEAPARQKEKNPFVICRVVADAGTKRLLVQSQVVLRSSCSCPLEVLLLPQDAPSHVPPGQEKNEDVKKRDEPQLQRVLLSPGKTAAVPVNRAAPRSSLPKLDLLRCCPAESEVEKISTRRCEETFPKGLEQEKVLQQRQVDFHMVILYRLERLFHSSLSCVQLHVSFEPPLRLASNIPFPIRFAKHTLSPLQTLAHDTCKSFDLQGFSSAPRNLVHWNLRFACDERRYKIHSPVASRVGESAPENLEGLLKLNDCQEIHSFPLAGVAFLSLSLADGQWSSRTQIYPRPLQRRRLSAETAQAAVAAAGSGRGQSAGSRMTSDAAEQRQGDASAETLAGDTVVEVECMDKRHRVAKLWVVFCDSDGGIPCLLIHAPVWLVSYVNWALQLQPQQHARNQGGHEKSLKTLPLVEFRSTCRNRPTTGGWALQAVSAAAAAVDLNPESGQQRPKPVARFGLPSGAGLTKNCDGEIQLLDPNTASFRVEAEGIGRSEYVDLWGEFPKTLQVTARSTSAQEQLASIAESSRGSSAQQSSAEAAKGCSRTDGGKSSSQPASAKTATCLDLIAAMSEAPMPLLRPVLLLTVGPMYTITNDCPFPLRVRQARPGYSCDDSSSVGVTFMMELLPQQTLPLVWQSAKGSRKVQFQCHRVLENMTTSSVWSAWSGHSPVCPTGEEWCLRLPASPGLGWIPPQPQAYRAKGATTEKCEQKQEPVESLAVRPDEQDTEIRERQSPACVDPSELVASLLRRGVTVESRGRTTRFQSVPRSSCADSALSAVFGRSLRLATEEGAASSINLVLREEQFELRDAVAISNNTPLPLLVRQCRHEDSAPTTNSKAIGGWSSGVGGNFPFSEAAAVGVDSVATAVADLWEAATRSEYEKRLRLNRADSSSVVLHSGTIYGSQNSGSSDDNVEASRQLINALLEKQRRAEQQRLQKPQGATFFHSSNAVYISSSPQREAVKRQLDRLVRLAESIAGSISLEQGQTRPQSSPSEPSSSLKLSEQCVWCQFDSAAAHELRAIEKEAGALSRLKEDESPPPSMWPFPQLVLPGETILFAWDDYRCLPCVELSYYPKLQQQQQKLATGRTSGQNQKEDNVHPFSELLSLERPFVICIPLHPSVSGVVPLVPLPSSCWLLFRVLRFAGRLRMQIVPAADLLGVPRSYAPVIPSNEEAVSSDFRGQKRAHQTPSHSSFNRSHAADGSPFGWRSVESEHIVASPSNVDVDTILSLPRYFRLSTVKDELNLVCSRSGSALGTDSRVPSWSYASMCRFAEALAGSYSPVRSVTRAAMAASAGVAAKPLTGGLRSKAAEGPLRPTPEPPSFELRIDVPRMQLSVLSQGPVTDPLYRQIDSMHSQAYYPVLLQRAPPLPNEATISRNSSSSTEGRGSDLQKQHQQRGKDDNQGVIGRGTGAEANAGFEPLVEVLLQQRHPLCDNDYEKLVLVDKCCIALRPVSVKTDLTSFYVATEALGCWRAAWAAATESAQLQLKGSMISAARASPAGSGRLSGDAGKACHAEASFVLSESDAPLGTKTCSSECEDLDCSYSLSTGLEWACNANSRWRFPFSLFASTLPEPGIGAAPSPLLLRPVLVKRPSRVIPEMEKRKLLQKRQKRYVFRLFSIAETCIVLSLKADAGGDTSALRRSVVTLSSLEDARFQVDGLNVTGHRLIEKLRELQQQQQPQLQQGLCLLTQVQKYNRLPALALRDVARLVGHFYRQQFVGHLSKVLVSVDLLGNPALSLAHLQAGVYALARQPLEAAETGGDVFQGMMRGAEDFLKHTGYGFFGGISRMAGVASDSLGALSCDEVYIHARKQQGRQKARNVEEGLQQGVEALGRALAGGFTGLVEEPVRGAAEGGFEGLIRGAGRGIAGFLVKPITGVLDLAHKTAEAIKDASQIEAYQRPRRRLPRMLLGPSRLLVAYDSEAAEAKAILTDAEGQNWGNLPVLFFALEKRLQRLTIVTESHVLLFKVNVRAPAELQFLSPIARVLAVGHCSMCTSSGSSSSSRNTPARERHLVVLQLRRTGEAGVCYKWLAYSSAQLQRHILDSLRQVLLH
ncbi:hypothetical protein Emag_000121 [Eimeria magna]